MRRVTEKESIRSACADGAEPREIGCDPKPCARRPAEDLEDLLEVQEWMLMRAHLKSMCGHY